jgi:ABC-type transport system involved in multi-copper enzyme maturation permease subunit
MRNQTLGGGAAASAIAAVVFLRCLRGRSIWIGLAFSLVPAVLALILTGLGKSDHGAGVWREVFTYSLSLLAIVPPLLVAGSIGDDLDDRTATYLWSRPLPRWSLVTGTLLAMVPLAFAILSVGVSAGFVVSFGAAATSELDVLARGLAALALGVLAVSAASAALATVSPRFATALAVVYVLFLDLPMSLLPVSLREISIGYQAAQVAAVQQYPASLVGALAALTGITGAWLAIALWRIGRVE